MVGVVVVDERAGALALELLAAEHAGEALERRGGAVDVYARQPDRRQGGAGVQRVVAARNAQLERRRPRLGRGEASRRSAPGGTTASSAGSAPRTTPDAGAANSREGAEELGARAPARVVVELDVGDDRNLGPKLEEARVGLVRLGDDPLARAEPGVRGRALVARPGKLAADEEGGIRAELP